MRRSESLIFSALIPLAGEANNLKSQSQQEGMCLEAQVNLYNMWTPIGKSDVKIYIKVFINYHHIEGVYCFNIFCIQDF